MSSARDAPALAQWPQFRGPFASGIPRDAAGRTDAVPLPVEWDVAAERGVLWRTRIKGLAHSSPVIAGELLFVTTAVREGEGLRIEVDRRGDNRSVEDDAIHSLRLIALDRRTGAIAWERECFRGVPRISRHPRNTHASSTPATDGERVVAHFASEGLYAFDLRGEPLWQRDLCVLDAGAFDSPETQYGSASSPVIHEGRVILQCDVQQGSFLGAFDAATGQDVWRTPRNDVPTWSTPTIHVSAHGTQIVCNGFRQIAGYDFDTGAIRWWLRGGGDIPVPTPFVWDGLVFLTSSHGERSPIYALRDDARGRIQEQQGISAALVWSEPMRGSYIPTPIVYAGCFYLVNQAGVLECRDAHDGTSLYRVRLGSGRDAFSASAVAGDGKLYFCSDTGEVHVIRAARAFERLATNALAESTLATPAIADGVLYFRTIGHVVAIGSR